MKHSLLLLAFLSTAVFLSAQITNLEVGDPFPLTEIEGMKGQIYPLDSGKVWVLNFWNRGCKPCEIERPYLNELFAQFKSQEGIRFASVTMNTERQLAEFLEDHPVDWPLFGGVDFLGITGDKTFMIKAMPTTIVVNQKSQIRYKHSGTILPGASGEAFMKLLTTVLEEE